MQRKNCSIPILFVISQRSMLLASLSASVGISLVIPKSAAYCPSFISARIVAQNGVPQVPMLLFISDGTGGTGFDKETWRRIQEKYISEVESGKYIELDCPHYVHDYEYGRISEEIKSFLSD